MENKMGYKIEPRPITPFDAESIENIKDMTYKKKGKRDIKVVSDELGKGRIMK